MLPLMRAGRSAEETVRRELLFMSLYFGAYLATLFLTREGEWAHWLSLVLIPLTTLWWLRRRQGLKLDLASVGLQKGRARMGIILALAAGGALSLLQLAGRQGEAIRAYFLSGQALYLLPLSFFLMLATAASTEEFFFRGVLQTRLTRVLRSPVLGILAASLLFGLFHLPYAYLNPAWPSAGVWAEAWRAALATGVPLGLVLGTVFVLSGESLLAPILLHALINLLPGMLVVARFLS